MGRQPRSGDIPWLAAHSIRIGSEVITSCYSLTGGSQELFDKSAGKKAKAVNPGNRPDSSLTVPKSDV
jgi:hypothetical protein